jgi:hypothetical protein
VLLNQLLGFGNLFRLEPVIRVEFNGRFDPELRFTVSMLDMHVRTRFFSREEVEAEASNAEDCRAHGYRIPESSRRSDVPRPDPQLRPAPVLGMKAA